MLRNLAQRTTHRTKNNWKDLERGKKTQQDRKKWKETVVALCPPLDSGLSQVSHALAILTSLFQHFLSES